MLPVITSPVPSLSPLMEPARIASFTWVRGIQLSWTAAATDISKRPYLMETPTHTPAWVYGLRQDQEMQTDLGIVNTGELGDETNLFSVEIYDGETGMLAHTIEEVELEARTSIRLESILEQNAPDTSQGYVRVSRISGSNPFVTFAVVSDGFQDSQSLRGRVLHLRRSLIRIAPDPLLSVGYPRQGFPWMLRRRV